MREHEHEHHHYHWHGRPLRFRWRSRGFDPDIESQIHDAMSQVEINLKTNLKPALKQVKRQLKHFDFDVEVQNVVDRAINAVQGWSVASAPEPPSETHTEERLTILRLVQEGKLTAEDAARLLDAL